jgi:hypothetical protein
MKTESTALTADELPGYDAPAPAPAPKPRRAARKPRPAAASAPQQAPQSPSVRRWATFGVAFTLVLSAGLNGYANAQHAPAAFAGWLMGLAVPVLVLVLSKVSGEKFRAGQRGVAWFAGGSGVSLLVLSVWHCSEAIALLTGSPVALALPLAVAIDAGLVSCEVALITESE